MRFIDETSIKINKYQYFAEDCYHLRLQSSRSMSFIPFVYLNFDLLVLKTFQNLKVSSADAVHTVDESGEIDI